MGFRQAAVLSPVSFFLGVLLICFNVDHRILYLKLTDEVIEDGFQFYATFFNAPPAIKATIHGLMAIGLFGLLTKLHKWDDGAMYFDGGSLAGYVFAIAVYITVIIPALRTIVTPAENVDTREDRIEAMRLLAAGNTIVMVILGAILALQAGQEYARRMEVRELAKHAAEEEKKKTNVSDSEKKQQ